MRTVDDNWKVLRSLLPFGLEQMAWQSDAVQRLRGFPSPELLLRTLLLNVARGYSLRETVVRARLARWTDISDVVLLKDLRKSEWLRLLCIGLLRENFADSFDEGINSMAGLWRARSSKSRLRRVASGGICTASNCRALMCDFFEVKATTGEGTGESLSRLPVGPRRPYSRGCRLLLIRRD
jgi:hypothetical protein